MHNNVMIHGIKKEYDAARGKMDSGAIKSMTVYTCILDFILSFLHRMSHQ